MYKLGSSALLTTLLFACGGGDDHEHCHTEDCLPPDAPASDAPAPDAPTDPDAPPQGAVQVVACDGAAIAADVITVGSSYDPSSVSIVAGEIVRFSFGGSHDAQSGVAGQPTSDFYIDFGDSACVRFNEAGSYPFFCTLHHFTGEITVSP